MFAVRSQVLTPVVIAVAQGVRQVIIKVGEA